MVIAPTCLGFLFASVYARQLLESHAPTPRLVSLQRRGGRDPSRGVGLLGPRCTNQPVSSRPSHCSPRPQRRPRTPWAPQQDGTWWRHPDPGAGLVAVRPEHGQGDRRAGPEHRARRPTADHPPDQHRPSRLGRHGRSGDPAAPAVGVVRRQLDLPAPDASEPVVPPGRGMCRGLAVITMEAGWVVTESDASRERLQHMSRGRANGNTGV